MDSVKELQARIQKDFTFTKSELIHLFIAILITAFIFSFNDWGDDTFDLIIGLRHFVLTLFIAALAFFGRFSVQKVFSLQEGYKAEFKPWLPGWIIALAIAFVTLGRVPLVLAGTVSVAFMVRHRLGAFRYGFSHQDGAVIGVWGILANMILATLFAIGLHYAPSSFFFSKGIILNLIMGFCALLPLPYLDGLHIFFGSRSLYYITIVFVLLMGLLLLTKALIGLILAIIIVAGMTMLRLNA
jgi:Zn-dependent protease